eukprot:6487509-Amphidinium_carterae.2
MFADSNAQDHYGGRTKTVQLKPVTNEYSVEETPERMLSCPRFPQTGDCHELSSIEMPGAGDGGACNGCQFNL